LIVAVKLRQGEEFVERGPTLLAFIKIINEGDESALG